MDRTAATAGMTAAYAAAGLDPPALYFAASPIGGAIMRQLLVQSTTRAGVWDGVWDGVGAGVWDGVRAGVEDGVEDGVRAGVGAGWHREVFYGSHDASWLGYYDWFRHHGMTAQTAPLDGMTQVAGAAGWCWLHRGFAVISDRPASLYDERVAGTTHRRRLHDPDGPSVTYRDGWSLWHWHGQLVPQWVIESPTVEAINAERNTEIRRCGIESFGWDRYLASSGVTPVDTTPDPGNPGHELRLFDLPGSMQVFGERVRLLVMENASRDRDGSRRKFAETVPVEIGDAVSAAAWQFGVAAGEYAELARAT